MQASVMVVSGAAFVLLLFVLVGGPMRLADWSRKRRQQETARQIALTDALDGQLGAIVSPVVRKPLFGPWQIQIAVPFHRSATVARILSVVDKVFPDVDGAGSRHYQIFLSAKPDSLRETRAPRTPRSTKRWARDPIPAA
jgi:hypothetical protein